MKRCKVLVTGGTGFIGGHLVEKLVEDGHYVRCLIRKTSNSKFLDKLGAEKVYGDIEDISSIDAALEDVNTIYHIVGILGKWTIPEEIYWRIHVKGTKNLLDAIVRRDDNIERLVHCSTAGVLGPIKDMPANESYPYNPTNVYEETKVEAEKLVLEYHKKFKIPITVIRPELVYGPRDLHTLKLFKTIKKGIFPIIGDGNSKLHPIYIDDLIKAFILCTDNGNTIGNTYLIGGDRHTTIKELTENIANALEVKRPNIYIPIKLANALAILMEFSAKAIPFDPPITKSRIRFFTENRGSTYIKAGKDFGYYPEVKLEDGLKKTIGWYKENNYI